MRRLSRVLAFAMLVLVAGVTVPASASSNPPPFQDRVMVWINAMTNQCLGVAGGVVERGTKIIVWPCNGARDQQWIAVDSGFHNFLIKNARDTSKCISVAAMSKQSQAQLVIWDCKDSETNHDQRWSIEETINLPDPTGLPYGSMFFTNGHSGLKMGVAFFPFPPRQVVQLYEPVRANMAWLGYFVNP
jgi:hypothetical protein